ncbi:hypothetical protein PHYPO_G00157700 [Pangasianodon hypophthalmus]|uniref:Uncharacterized protein n=1 Tax=Pangasianodon hypophthalmus TaxID=310915 RepID=A0A5N5JU84_PANHP|nr:hypothetical protein PHYPO_G00157700 [Pangasianodon hypophthalmus]
MALLLTCTDAGIVLQRTCEALQDDGYLRVKCEAVLQFIASILDMRGNRGSRMHTRYTTVSQHSATPPHPSPRSEPPNANSNATATPTNGS